MSSILRFAALAALLVGARFVPTNEFISPYLALLFAAGFLTRSAWAGVLTLATFVATDLVLGTWSGSWLTVSLTVLFFLAGAFSTTALRAALSGFVGITLFYLSTNALVWYGSAFYPQDWSGLMESYVGGWPFYRAQLVGLFAVGTALCLWQGRDRNPNLAALTARLQPA